MEIFDLLKADIPHTCVVENEGGKDRSCRDERRWCGRVRRTVQVTVNLHMYNTQLMAYKGGGTIFVGTNAETSLNPPNRNKSPRTPWTA